MTPRVFTVGLLALLLVACGGDGTVASNSSNEANGSSAALSKPGAPADSNDMEATTSTADVSQTLFAERQSASKLDLSAPLVSLSLTGKSAALSSSAANKPQMALQTISTEPSGFYSFGAVNVGGANATETPNPSGAASTTHYVLTAQREFAFHPIDLPRMYGPYANNTLWAGFGGPCETQNDGDARVIYDSLNDRWVFMQAAQPLGGAGYQCFAVSTTTDPAGTYYRYAFPNPSATTANPRLANWGDAYYATYNTLNGTTPTGTRVCAFDKNAMVQGLPATQQCVQLSSTYQHLLPADMESGSLAPPIGSSHYLMSMGGDTRTLRSWKFAVDWANPTNTSLTGPTNLSTARYQVACGGAACIPQTGTSQLLNPQANMLSGRLVYRNYGNLAGAPAYEQMALSHPERQGASTTGFTGIRWYLLRNMSSTAIIDQSGTYAPDNQYRWLSNVALGRLGTLYLSYEISSSTSSPRVGYSAFNAGVWSAESAGYPYFTTGSKISGPAWGTTTSINLRNSPYYNDICETPYQLSAYLPANGVNNWQLRIAALIDVGRCSPA